jgi:hypothetical protein
MFSPSHAHAGDNPPSEPWDGACNAADSAAFAAAHASRTTPGHFRRSAHLLRGAEAVDAHSVTLSSLGVGTYLGRPDDATDAAVSAAVRASIDAGWNVIDSAISTQLPPRARRARHRCAGRFAMRLPPAVAASAAAFHLPDIALLFASQARRCASCGVTAACGGARSCYARKLAICRPFSPRPARCPPPPPLRL